MDIPQSFLHPALVRDIPLPTAHPLILGKSQTCASQPRAPHSGQVPARSWAGSTMSLSPQPPILSPPCPGIRFKPSLCSADDFSPQQPSINPLLSTSTSVLLPLESVHICTGPSCYSPRCVYSEIFKNPVFSCHSFRPATLQRLPTARGAKYGLRLRAAPSPALWSSKPPPPRRAAPPAFPPLTPPAGACPQPARALLLLLPLPGMPLPSHFASLTP